MRNRPFAIVRILSRCCVQVCGSPEALSCKLGPRRACVACNGAREVDQLASRCHAWATARVPKFKTPPNSTRRPPRRGERIKIGAGEGKKERNFRLRGRVRRRAVRGRAVRPIRQIMIRSRNLAQGTSCSRGVYRLLFVFVCVCQSLTARGMPRGRAWQHCDDLSHQAWLKVFQRSVLLPRSGHDLQRSTTSDVEGGPANASTKPGQGSRVAPGRESVCGTRSDRQI